MDKENLTSPDSCEHIWSIKTYSSGDRNGISICSKCGLWFTHAERLSWESLKNQKSISLISAALSIIAIIVSMASLYFSSK